MQFLKKLHCFYSSFVKFCYFCRAIGFSTFVPVKSLEEITKPIAADLEHLKMTWIKEYSENNGDDPEP